MRIVCESCSTKYSIADEKVRGKVFKIRCKKCDNVIVVKGSEGGEGAKTAPAPHHEAAITPAPAPTDSSPRTDATTAAGGAAAAAAAGATAAAAGAAAAATAVWHVAIGNDQKGPFTVGEVKERASRGEINGSTFVWREGLGDWKPLSDVVEFADLVPATDVAREQPMFGGGSRAGAELFGQTDEGPASGELKIGQGVVSSDMPDAFGGQNMFSEADQQAAGEESPEMTGARRDTSVLFSLSNLTSMAGGGAGGATAKAPAGAPKAAPQRTEGSGLIDIRQMASSISTTPADDVSDLGGYSPAVAAPVLLPVMPSGPPKWVLPLAIGGGVVLLGLIGAVVFLVAQKPEQVVVQAPPPPPAQAPASAAAPDPTTPTPPEAEKTAPREAAAPDEVVASAEPSKEEDKPSSSPRRRTSRRSKEDEPATPAPQPKPEPESTPAKKKPASGGDDLDALLSGAVPGGGGSRPTGSTGGAGTPDEEIPETLSRTEIQKGMSKILPDVQQCNARFRVPGTVSTNITIARTGRIQTAAVTGQFAGTPTGNCVQTAVRRASFPKFSGPPISITYPFVMR